MLRRIPPAAALLSLALPALLVLSAAPDAARAAEKSKRTHDIKPTDYFSLAHIIDVAPSPDGGTVAYVEMRWETPEKGRNIDLWTVDTAGKRRRLTFDYAADTGPQWSPDSAWIYFASSRKVRAAGKAVWNGKRQVWRIRRDGTDLTQVTRVGHGVSAWQLSADGDSIYFEVRTEQFDKDAFGGLRKKHKGLRYGHGRDKYSQIWKLSLTEWRRHKLTGMKRVARQWRVSPDGRRIAMLTTPDHHLVSNEGWSRVDIYDTRTHKTFTINDDLWRRNVPSPYGWLLGLAWSADSTRLAHRVDYDGYPGEVFVTDFLQTDDGDTEDGKAKTATKARTIRLDRPKDAGLKVTWTGGHLAWRPGTDALCLNATRNAIDAVWCIGGVKNGRQGAATNITKDSGGSVGTFDFARNDKLFVFAQSGVTYPVDVFAAGQRVGKGFRKLTNINPQVDTWKLPTIKSITWKSKDGSEVHGILELPPGYDASKAKKAGKKLPLLVEIHGGPTSASRHRLRFWIYGRTLFAARGWATLSPNYRGSTGFGDKFMVDLIGHKNDRDVDDILAGVDKVIADGIADAKKMAVMGWSNGGYLTNCVIARTTRFKAASSGAGVFDTAMQWMIEDTPGHVVNFNKGLPWTAAAGMKKSSPLYDVHKVKTPTLIHVGEKDPRVPAAHSRALFRSLYRYLKVPTELIVYPGEPHGLRQYRHRKAKMLWDVAWLDHYVLGRKPGAKPDKPGKSAAGEPSKAPAK